MKYQRQNLNPKNRIKMQYLKMLHWNPNSLWEKTFELSLLIKEFEPDIVSINESKLNELKSFYLTKLNNYNYIFKVRNNEKCAGGVILIIKKDIKFEDINIDSNLETIAIKITKNMINCIIMSDYCPPDQPLNEELIQNITKLNANVIICGDLNSRSLNLGCKGSNTNGIILEKIILETNLVILNNNQYTFQRIWSGYTKKLDLFLASPNMARKMD